MRRFDRRDFLARCNEPNCGRQGLCLPATDLNPKRNTHRFKRIARWTLLGYWTWVEPFYVYIPERMSLASALRRHRRATDRHWRAICVRCLAVGYVENAAYDIRTGSWAGSLFGKLSARLGAVRMARQPYRALDGLLPRLEREVVRTLRWLWRPRTQRAGARTAVS